MTCYFPLNGYVSREGGFTFSASRGYIDRPLSVPCGKCLGCRLDRSRSWAIRCMHEASLYSSNCFITLTYRSLPADGSLTSEPSDFTLFMKRLRKKFSDLKIRYFMCGEYGDAGSRPHYHACIFNLDFPDRYLWSNTNGVNLYRSPILESLWPHGFSTVGDVTEESAAYVARYVLKKASGANKHMNYISSLDLETGEATFRRPEYVTMSRGGRCSGVNLGGIGKRWIEKYKDDVYPHDAIIKLGGSRLRPPRYYDNIYDTTGGDLESVKISRKVESYKRREDNSSQRLAVRYEALVLKSKKLIRSYENAK